MVIQLTIFLSLAVTALGCLLAHRRAFQGTTLIAAWRWAIVSLFVLMLTELSAWLLEATQPTQLALRYLAGTTTLCPLMALLGAKRPQDRAWQLIVATFWIVLVLPVGETWLLWHGGTLEVGAIRRWFLLILVAVGLANYIPTRFAVTALLVALGQGFLLAPQLPLLSGSSWPAFEVGMACLAFGIALGCWPTRASQTRTGWNRVWRDFRDAYGLVWSVRVMERINATARRGNWQCELTWEGFTRLDEVSDVERRAIVRCLVAVLRRFVSTKWTAQRSNNPECKSNAESV